MALVMAKRLIYASFAVVGLVSLAAVADLILAVPFGGSMVFDILFLIAAATVGYLAWDALRELA